MAHLSDDDVPTMTGTGSLVEELEDSGDTTSADLGVPVAAAIHAAAEAALAEKAAPAAEAAERDDEIDGHDAEDRTMSNAPSTVATGAGPPTHQSAVAPIPRGVVLPSPSPTTVDDDELEDSVTTTAPRVPHSSLAIPGSVLIRTVEEDDDMQDETEVKTLANLPPDLQKVLKNARMQDANAPQRSQPPPPPRPAAGVPARPATGPMPVSAAVATLPSRVDEPAATTIPQTEPLPPAAIPTELDSDELADDDDDDVLPADEEGPTAQSLAPRVGSMPDSVVGPPSPIAAAPKDPAPTSRASAIEPETSKSTASEAVAAAMVAAGESDEPETRPGLGGDASATDDPPTRPGLVDPPTRPGLGEPPTHPRSVDGTSSPRIDVRPAAETDHDDSITTQAPKHASDLIADAIANVTSRATDDDDDDDSTEGTTTKVKRSKLLPAPPPAAGAPPPTSKEPPLPADEESESITTQAPGPLTNMLRVIAADRASVPDGETIEEQEPEENRTAVMANAPLIRAAEAHQQQNGRSPLSVPTQLGLGPRAVAAQQLNPTSESGLRVARPGSGSGERISTAAMNAAPTSPIDPRISGIGPSASARGGDGGPHGLAHANTELAFPQMPGQPPPAQQPSMHDVPAGKSPSYGPLVAIVAIVSFVVPVTLFLALRGNDADPKPGTPNEASSDFQKLDAPSRTKVDKNKKSPDAAGSASATPSASASSKGPNRFPFNRR